MAQSIPHLDLSLQQTEGDCFEAGDQGGESGGEVHRAPAWWARPGAELCPYTISASLQHKQEEEERACIYLSLVSVSLAS